MEMMFGSSGAPLFVRLESGAFRLFGLHDNYDEEQDKLLMITHQALEAFLKS